MIKRTYETIIIGSGVSGLSCAYELNQNNKKFKIITRDIGGRILKSSRGHVEYGAYYIMGIYHQTKPFAKLGRRINPTKIRFHKGKHSYKLWDKKLFTHLPQVLRLILLLRKFKKHYELFKKKCLSVSQAEAIKSDPYLLKLYKQNAKQLLKDNNINEVVYDYMAEVLHGTTFTSIDKLNSFTFLQFSLPLIVPIYEFIFLKDKIIKKFKKDIIKDSVIKIKKQKDVYLIVTKKNKYYSKNVVVACPIHISQKLLNLQTIKKPVNAHMFHVIGQIKEDWNYCEENLFSDKNRMLAIAHQPDGSFLFYSKGKNPKFEEYFYEYKIIKHKFWNPAFNLEGNVLLECKQDENLYLIGDHNVCGLEDSFITGLYAANQIINSN